MKLNLMKPSATVVVHVVVELGVCTESSPRGQAGELLLLFEAKQGRSSGKTEAAAARFGAGDEDPGEDGVAGASRLER